MRAGIDHAIGFEILRKVDARSGIAKAKLQHLHAGYFRPLAQRIHFRRNQAQIFRDERKIAQPRAQHFKQIVRRALHPPAVDRRRSLRGNFPVALKAAEMVQPHDIAHLQRPAHASHPPVVAGRFARVPAIQWVPPALSGFTEGVRRNARHHRGLQIFVKIEKIGIAPDVGAVIVHKDGNVAHDPDAALRAVEPQRAPLFEKRKLDGALHFQLALVFHAKLVQACRFTSRQLSGPRTPGGTGVDLAHHVKQHKIFQPPGIVPLEPLKAFAIAVPAFKKVLRRRFEQRQLERLHLVKINARVGSGLFLERVFANPAAFRQPFQADEKRVRGKRGDGGIGRIAQPRRRERQHLPKAQAGA